MAAISSAFSRWPSCFRWQAEFVGKIPEPLQSITRYAAGVPVNAEHPEAAKRLLAYLQSGDAQAVARATGLDPVSP